MRSTRKELKALTTGADYATKAAGATSVGLSALALCGIVISTSVSLGIAGAIGAIFCCAGACSEWKRPDQEVELEHKIDDIENKLEQVIDYQQHTHPKVLAEHKQQSSEALNRSSVKSSRGCCFFCCHRGNPTVKQKSVVRAPQRQTMDEEGQKGYGSMHH